MARRVIYRTLLIATAALLIFFLGSIFEVENPVLCLLITLVLAGFLSVGYYLGGGDNKNK